MMKKLEKEVWDSLPFVDYRQRFFIESIWEYVGRDTPHFYQSRLMNVFACIDELGELLDDLDSTEKVKPDINNTIIEMEHCWSNDDVANELLGDIGTIKALILKSISGGDYSSQMTYRLKVLCKLVNDKKPEYLKLLLKRLRESIIGTVDLNKKSRVLDGAHHYIGLYVTYLQNMGYSPTYLYNRMEMFTRQNNYKGKDFAAQFSSITDSLNNAKRGYSIYFSVKANRTSQLEEDWSSFNIIFAKRSPEGFSQEEVRKCSPHIEPNIYAKVNVETTDYITAALKGKELLDKALDFILSASSRLRIQVSSICLVSTIIGGNQHTNSVNIGVLSSFLSSESARHHNGDQHTLLKCSELLTSEGKEHLGRSLRYLRLGIEASSYEQKFLNIWIALESLFISDDGRIIDRIKNYIPKVYALSGICRRLVYLRELLIYHAVSIPPSVKAHFDLENDKFGKDLSLKNTYEILLNESLVVDIFDALEDSEHLKYRIKSIFEDIRDVKSVRKRIVKSTKDVEMQLTRLYWFRNKIAHQGYFENIRPQLISHLLDYLSCCYISIIDGVSLLGGNNETSIQEALAAYILGSEKTIRNIDKETVLKSFEELLPCQLV